MTERAIMNTTTKTPIEIALGVDENGMTTARKLYEFLELHPAAYSRWFKQNIIENGFATANEDYFPFNTNVECGGQASKDAKLTADFAKKLSMTAKNEKGEQARNYFVKVENIAKETVLQMDGLSTEMKALIMHDKKIVEQDARLDALEDSTKLSSCERKKIKKAIHSAVANACGGKKTMAYAEHSKKVYSALYGFLYDYYDVSEYADIPKIKYAETLTMISEWYPDYELKQRINVSNNVGD